MEAKKVLESIHNSEKWKNADNIAIEKHYIKYKDRDQEEVWAYSPDYPCGKGFVCVVGSVAWDRYAKV